MKKQLIVLLIFPFVLNIFAQDLNSAWDEINKAFNNNDYSTVISKAPDFIS